jgi:Ca2+-binding EF-hand superfamily protein
VIIKSLMPSVEEKELGPMYELFDKDSNGVIDLE